MSEECRVITKEQYDYYKSLEKKLDIAVNVLAAYSDTENWKVSNMWTGTYYGHTLAKEALEAIEDVK